jgi:hypothetical protein
MPVFKLRLDDSDDLLQYGKIVQALTARQLPDPLNRARFGAVGRQVIQHTVLDV